MNEDAFVPSLDNSLPWVSCSVQGSSAADQLLTIEVSNHIIAAYLKLGWCYFD
jgi:hypothetical protein